MNISILFRFDGETPPVACRDLLSLALERTDGDPCCAFEARLIYSDAAADAAHRASTIQIYHGGTLRFTGVLDEVVTSRDASGGTTLELAGRSYAALLIEHELGGVEFERAAWKDIRAYCVAPCGDFAVRASDDLGSLERFSITSGTNAWRALCDWAGAAAKVSPRFDVDGTLLLERTPATRGVLGIDAASPLISAERRRLRRGVVSAVTVSERSSGRRTTVRSELLGSLGYGGRAAIAAPTTALSTRVPQAEWLLAEAEREAETLELTLAGAFAAEPRDALRIALAGFPATATVASARTEIDMDGARTILTAYPPLG